MFIGTLYPLFLDAVGGPKISVGFPFFNQTFVPLMVPLLLAVGPGTMLAWKRGDLLGALQRLWAAFGVAIVVMLAAFYATHGGPVLAVLGLGLAAWAVRRRGWRNWPSGCACSASRSADSLRRARQPAARRLGHDASPISAWRSRSPASPPRPSQTEAIDIAQARRRH